MATSKKAVAVQDATKPDIVKTATKTKPRTKKGTKSRPAVGATRGGEWLPSVCTKADLAVVLNISMRALSDLDARGLLVTASKKGTYQTIPTLHGYIDRLRLTASGRVKEMQSPAAEERNKRERIERETAEYKLKQLRGEMLSVDEVSASWTTFSTKVKAFVLSIPSKARSAIPHLTAHDAAELKTICVDGLIDLADEVEAAVIGGNPDEISG